MTVPASRQNTSVPLSDARLVLLLNVGAASIKSAILPTSGPVLQASPLWRGSAQDIGSEAAMWRDSTGATVPLQAGPDAFGEAGRHLLQAARSALAGRPLRAIGHRLLTAAADSGGPRRINAATMRDEPGASGMKDAQKDKVIALAAAAGEIWPGCPQVASFDTAFHRSLPLTEQLLPIPGHYWDLGLRRHGAHGISYEYLSVLLERRYGHLAHGRVIAAHLGAGASLCAMLRGRSMAVSRGLNGSDGLVTGTSAGLLPPSAVCALIEREGNGAGLHQLLFGRSGLLGVSGLSADPRVLQRAELNGGAAAERAHAALSLYVRDVVREIGALATLLGGLDLLAFTGGIGQHNADLRNRICEGLGLFGVTLDTARNARGAGCISTPASKVLVTVEASGEE